MFRCQRSLVIWPIDAIDPWPRIGAHGFTIRDTRPEISLAATAPFRDHSNRNQRHQNRRWLTHEFVRRPCVAADGSSIMAKTPGHKDGLHPRGEEGPGLPGPSPPALVRLRPP